MFKTKIEVDGVDFLINGKKTYFEVEGVAKKHLGLLMNARFIQGIFDDKQDVERFNRAKKEFEPNKNTTELIENLQAWYDSGLRAFTVGLQGGGPCFTIKNNTIDNNPYSEDGKEVDPKYLERLDRLIKAADEVGMVVIVSYFYPGQLTRMKDGVSIMNAVETMSKWLKDQGYTNIIIEVCNELNVDHVHPIINTDEGMSVLIELARRSSGGLLVGCSFGGGGYGEQVTKASDVILVHGNGCDRTKLYKMIRKIKDIDNNKPIVFNEDSQAISNMKVCMDEHVSWGYYNNMTKQEPPTYWEITTGEDEFFAKRLMLELRNESKDNEFHLQGLDDKDIYNDERFIRVASLYPEKIDYVNYYLDGELIDRVFSDPFPIYFQSNWQQKGLNVDAGDTIEAEIKLVDGTTISKKRKLV